MKCHVCLAESTAVTPKTADFSIGCCLDVSRDVDHEAKLAWTVIIVCWWEMCLYQKQGIVSRSIFCCLIPLCAEIGRNAWRVVSDSLESSYWANAESLVVAFLLSLGEQSIFHCPACSEPRPLAAARLFLRYVCSVFLIRKIRQSGEWKRLFLMSLIIQRENGEAVNEAAENGELGVTVKCCCFFLSSNHS